MSLTTEQLAELSIQFALSKKAEDVVRLDLRSLTNVTDFFIICTAFSNTHARSISEGIQRGLRKKYGDHVWHVEGEDNASWILLDYVDVVIHIFQKDERTFYSLERLWGDAERKEYTPADFNEAMVALPTKDNDESS